MPQYHFISYAQDQEDYRFLEDQIKCLIGYSGRILNTKHLSKNISSRPKIYLMHGDIDNVVPINSLLEAKEFFSKNPRMRMLVNSYDKMDENKKNNLNKTARKFLMDL